MSGSSGLDKLPLLDEPRLLELRKTGGPAGDGTPRPGLRLDDLGETCNVPEACQVLGCGLGLGYRMVADGTFPGVLRLGRKVRISTSALRKYLEEAGHRPARHGLQR
jgi:excisionase family DNA binding protein